RNAVRTAHDCARGPERERRARSRSKPLPLRVEERLEPDPGAGDTAVDLDVDLRIFPRELRAHPGHADRSAEVRAESRARHTASGPSAEHDLPAFGRNHVVRHFEPD